MCGDIGHPRITRTIRRHIASETDSTSRVRIVTESETRRTMIRRTPVREVINRTRMGDIRRADVSKTPLRWIRSPTSSRGTDRFVTRITGVIRRSVEPSTLLRWGVVASHPTIRVVLGHLVREITTDRRDDRIDATGRSRRGRTRPRSRTANDAGREAHTKTIPRRAEGSGSRRADG